MHERTILCVVAHPDDETFGAGGALVHAVANGATAVTVCATRGEAGEIMDRSNATPETLAAVRELEYRRAGRIMGISESILLDYRDSGMPGTPENEDPAAFIQQPEDRVVADITAVMERVRPDVIITSEPGGGYGHPDHIFAARCAMRAFDEARAREAETGWAPRKLYHYTFPRSHMRMFVDEIRKRDPGSPMAQLDPGRLGSPDEEITLRLDISNYSDLLREAYAAHVSQISPVERMSDELGRLFMSMACLVRYFPEPSPSEQESDIFDGLD